VHLPPLPSSLSYYRPVLLLSLFSLCLRISRFQIEFPSVTAKVAASAATPRGEVIFYSEATPPLLYRCVPPL